MDSDDPSSRGTTTARIEELLDPLRVGDEKAIAAFFEIADERIRIIARRILRGNSNVPNGRTDEIISLSSEALLEQLREGLATRCESPRRIMGYLAETIRKKAIDLARQRSGIKHRTQFPALQLPPDPIGSVGKRITFYQLIDDLPDREREVVDLRIMGSCTFREIAELLNISETTAKTVWARAMIRLKRDFDAS